MRWQKKYMTSELFCSLQDLEQKIRDGNRNYLHKNKGFNPGLQMRYATNNTLLDELKLCSKHCHVSS